MKRLLIVLATAGVAVLALAGPASAHVTITAPGATRGGSDQAITFNVPVEEKVATVGVTIQLPTDTPIASVLVDPMPGWTHTQVTSTLATPIKTDDGEITSAVTQISWTALAGHGIEPGEYGSFTILAGALPDAATLTFKALQRYRDGSVTKWIEVAAPGSNSEPEHPAPVLSLAAASSAAVPARSSASTESSASSGSSSSGSTVLAIIALVLAAGAGGLAVVTRAQGRRS